MNVATLLKEKERLGNILENYSDDVVATTYLKLRMVEAQIAAASPVTVDVRS